MLLKRENYKAPVSTLNGFLRKIKNSLSRILSKIY